MKDNIEREVLQNQAEFNEIDSSKAPEEILSELRENID